VRNCQSNEGLIYDIQTHYKRKILNWQESITGSGDGGRLASRGRCEGKNTPKVEKPADQLMADIKK
jgi:hypothetical protein